MYPFINRVCHYGIGEVTIIRDNFETIDKYFGLAQCVILPPKSLLRGMVENYCPEVKLNLGLLFTKARRAEVNSSQG